MKGVVFKLLRRSGPIICLAAMLPSLLGAGLLYGQSRLRVRLHRQDPFAGKFLYLPIDSRPVSLQLPDLLSRVADHDLRMPPVSMLGNVSSAGDPRRLREWLGEVDVADIDGAVVSLDMLLRGGSRNAPLDEARVKENLAALARLRAQRPGLACYGFVGYDEAINRIALDALAAGSLDYLIIGRQDLPAKEGDALLAEIERRGLKSRAQVIQGLDAAPQLLIARLMLSRFGLTPKIWVGATSTEQAASVVPIISGHLAALGALVVPAGIEATGQADLLLFAQLPGTTAQARAGLLETVAAATGKGLRVAVADLSGESESRNALFAELRGRKLFDHLFAFSAAPEGKASAEALAQAVARLVTAKFLRDDIDRLQRSERAQVELTLAHAIREFIYPQMVAPRVEAHVGEHLKGDAKRLGAERERAEVFARDELMTLSEEFFREQFQRNRHMVLLSTGKRAEYEVRSLERVHLRFTWGAIQEPEMRFSVYLPLINLFSADRAKPSPIWELIEGDGLDEKLLQRFISTRWSVYPVDAESVEVAININRREVSPEGYTIQTRRRGRNVRRVEISASSVRGAFYAIGRLEQLAADGRLGEDLQLAESPALAQRGVFEGAVGRSWSHRDRLDLIRLLGRMRMNRYYYASKNDGRDVYSAAALNGIEELLRTAEENCVDLVYAITPDPSLSYASEDDMRALLSRIDAVAALGVRHFALAFNDHSGDGEEALEKSEDRARFSTLAAAHAHLINRVHAHLGERGQKSGQSLELAVVPALSAASAGGDDYLRELGASIPRDVFIFWVKQARGAAVPEAASTSATPAASAFTPAAGAGQGGAALAGRRPLIWAGFPGSGSERRLRLGPFPPAEAELASSGEALGLIANLMSQPHASMLPLATVADYAWDPRAYNPQQSHARALKMLYDERTAGAVRRWAEVYSAAGGDPFAPLFGQDRGSIDKATIARQIEELQKALEAMGQARESGLLRGELAVVIGQAQRALQK